MNESMPSKLTLVRTFVYKGENFGLFFASHIVVEIFHGAHSKFVVGIDVNLHEKKFKTRIICNLDNFYMSSELTRKDFDESLKYIKNDMIYERRTTVANEELMNCIYREVTKVVYQLN